jgi:protocatechuate 3,4-dioxygenase beta subunit
VEKAAAARKRGGEEPAEVIESLGEPDVTVRVLSESGEPLKDAKVSLYPSRNTPRNTRRSYSRVTNSGGRAFFFNVNPGDYTVRIRCPRYFPPTEHPELTFTKGAHLEREYTLERAAVVSGKACDEDGNPVARVRLSIQESYPEDKRRGRKNTYSKQDGSFTFDGLKPGTYNIKARRNGFIEAEEHAITLGADQVYENLEIVMCRGEFVSGEVMDEDGAPVVGARVYAYQKTRHSHARTDAVGAFRITGMEAGACRVQAHKAGYRTATEKAVEAGTGGLSLVLKKRSDSSVIPIEKNERGELLDVRERRRFRVPDGQVPRRLHQRSLKKTHKKKDNE